VRIHVALLAALTLTLAACSSGDHDAGKGPAASASAGVDDKPPVLMVPTEEVAVNDVRASVKKHKWTTLGEDCLSFINYPADAQGYVVDVHELHNARCGGDPDVSPRLFTYQIDRASGHMQTDASDPAAGLFHAVD
jgi:hypothetical protein